MAQTRKGRVVKDSNLDLPATPAYREARAALPEDLQSHFDELVQWYRYFASFHYNHPFVSYKILADLVREGWRMSGESIR